jgi:hypothetical protein
LASVKFPVIVSFPVSSVSSHGRSFSNHEEPVDLDDSDVDSDHDQGEDYSDCDDGASSNS